MLPFVTVIMPTRNEEPFLERCLETIVANDYPKDRLEVLVIDGMSDDRTKEIASVYASRYDFVRVLENRRRVAAVAQNIGVRESRGDVIIIVDAHSEYCLDYISQCVEHLLKYPAASVGGAWQILPRGSSPFQKAAAAVLANPIGVGNAKYRTSPGGAPTWVETVPYGCHWKSMFARIGLYDERLSRSYDVDFNRRIQAAGGRILLVPSIVIKYHARVDAVSFVKHNFLNGRWVTYPLAFGKCPFFARHLAPLALVLGLMLCFAASMFSSMWLHAGLTLLGSYLSLAVAVSVAQGLRSASLVRGFWFLVAFLMLHVSFGLGSVWGMAAALFGEDGRLRQLVRGERADVPGADQ